MKVRIPTQYPLNIKFDISIEKKVLLSDFKKNENILSPIVINP